MNYFKEKYYQLEAESIFSPLSFTERMKMNIYRFIGCEI